MDQGKGEGPGLAFLRTMGSQSASAPGSLLGSRSCALLAHGRPRRNFGLQCILLSSKPSEDAHEIVREGSWQKRAGSQRAHLRGWGVMEALRMTPSQSPRGLKYHSFILLQFCRSDVKSVSPRSSPGVGRAASLGGGLCFLIFSGFWRPLHSLARGLFLTSANLLFHRLLPPLVSSSKNASDHTWGPSGLSRIIAPSLHLQFSQI